MGEIADALRRAGAQGAKAPRRRPDPRREEHASADDSHAAEHAVAGRSPNAPAARRGPAREDTPVREWAVQDVVPEPEPEAPATAAPAEPADEASVQKVVLSDSPTGTWSGRVVLADERGAAAERYRQFAVRVDRELNERKLQSVLVTSALRGEGKTTTSCNLALALAGMAGSRSIALVDLDLRSPAVAAALDVIPGPGLESVLQGRAPLEAARLRTDFASLDLYLPQHPSKRAHELLSEARFAEVLRALSTRYDRVIVDSAPMLLVPDSALLLEHIGACICVASLGLTRIHAFREMLEMIPEAQRLGAFVNRAPAPAHAAQYGYYGEEAPKPAVRRSRP